MLIKFPLGRILRAFAGHEEIKWDARRMQFAFNSLTGILEIWNMQIADPVKDEFVIPNFTALVEVKK